MSKQSGGAMAANPREGFRSESLARFALSAFGPATDVEVEDDHGVDLVCATAARVGSRLHVGPGYLVQVKSDDVTVVTYEGPHARTWLEGLGSPLLICRVDKATARIRLYSTWNLSRVLVQHAAYGLSTVPPPDVFRLVMDEPVTTADPSEGSVPLGIPVVDFKITDLHAREFTDNIRSCIEEWVAMDTENIVRRRSGLAIAKGYTNWESNKPPSQFNHHYKPYFYSPIAAQKARAIIVECATLISLLGVAEETRTLAHYCEKFCDPASIERWSLERLGIQVP